MREHKHVLERVDGEQRQVVHAFAEVMQRVREPVSVRRQKVHAVCWKVTHKGNMGARKESLIDRKINDLALRQ